jgi:hypothetical protein
MIILKGFMGTTPSIINQIKILILLDSQDSALQFDKKISLMELDELFYKWRQVNHINWLLDIWNLKVK